MRNAPRPAEGTPVIPAAPVAEAGARRRDRPRAILEAGAVTALFVALTAGLARPLVARFGTHIWGKPQDNFEFLWKLWWVPHRIGTHRSVYFAPHVFPQAGGYDLGSTDMSATATFLFAPLTAAAGPVVAYNLVLLLSFVLAGLGTYLLARRLGAGKLAAFVAGAAFAFCPFHFWQGSAHLNVAQIGYTPWVFLAADRLVDRRRWTHGFWLGLALALAGLTTWYRLVFLLFTVPMFVLVRNRQAGARMRQLVRPLGVAAATTVALTLPFLLPAVSYAARGGQVPPFTESALYGLSVEDYLMPPPGHPVTDYWIDDALTRGEAINYERVVYPGIVVLALAVACTLTPALRRRASALGAVAAVAAVLSFGPVLRWFGTPVVFDLGLTRPSSLHQVVLHEDPAAGKTEMAVPMPVYPIARYAPGLRGLRAWARAAEITTLALAVMAGLALTALLGRLPRSARLAAAIAVLGLVLVDAHMRPNRLVRPAPRPVDTWLAHQPGHARIIELPWLSGQSGTQLYYSIRHGKEVALTQASAFPPMIDDGRTALVDTFPHGHEWVRVLQRWGVTHLLVDESTTPIPNLREAIAANGLTAVTRKGTVQVWTVPLTGETPPDR